MNSKTVQKSTKKWKKYKQTVDYYDLPLYHSRIAVVNNPDPQKISKQFGISKEQLEKDWEEGGTYGLSYGGGKDKKTGDYLQLILIFPHPDNLMLVNTCAHEALHAAQDILYDRGMKLCDDTHEAYAYLVGWIAMCIYKTATKK